MNKASRAHRSEVAPAADGSTPGSLLLSTVIILFAVFALTLGLAFAQNRTEGNVTVVQPSPERTLQQPSLKLSSSKSSVNSCPNEAASAQVRLTASDSNVRALPLQWQYDWKVSAGHIEGKGASVIWVLSGVKPGTYSATVTGTTQALIAAYSASAETLVTVERCQIIPPTCPRVSLTCPQSATAGETLAFKAAWRGGTPNVKPTYVWRASVGRIIKGQGTPEILLDTTDIGGRKISLTFFLLGFGLTCRTECGIIVQPLPTPTPTPTLTPTPTPSPSPSLTPTSSPSASATTLSSPIPSGGQNAYRLWPWLILGGVVALCAGALLIRRYTRSHSTELSDTDYDSVRGRADYQSAHIPIEKRRDSILNKISPVEERMEAIATGEQIERTIIIGKEKKVADEVHCTVFAPEQAAPGDPFQVQVFAHLLEQAGQLAALAARADDAARDQGSKALSQPIERETKITFSLQMPGLKVQGRKQSLIWRGVVDYVQFAVDVPEDCEPQNIRGVVKIYYGENALVGQIMFMFKVVETGAPRPTAASIPAPPPQKEIKFTHAFISYSSKDRSRVLMGLQGLRKGWKQAGITDFIDLQDIKSGEHWREVIQRNLDKCDLFVLFWSSAAKQSEEVMKEVSYALARKRGSDENPPAFDPLTIELPLPQPLPGGLESLHFGDDLLHLIKAEEALAAERAARPAAPDEETGRN